MPEAPFGSFAELCPIHPRRTVPLPDSLDDITAAAIANPGMSAWGSLVHRAHLLPGETVLINGATGTATEPPAPQRSHRHRRPHSHPARPSSRSRTHPRHRPQRRRTGNPQSPRRHRNHPLQPQRHHRRLRIRSRPRAFLLHRHQHRHRLPLGLLRPLHPHHPSLLHRRPPRPLHPGRQRLRRNDHPPPRRRPPLLPHLAHGQRHRQPKPRSPHPIHQQRLRSRKPQPT
jgi:hypothetical protein